MVVVRQNIVKNIKRLYLLMNKHIEGELKKYGLARSQFQVIYFVHQHKKLTQKKLHQIMQVKPATLTVIIDGLVKKGLLTRSENVSDKRSKVIHLTEKGDNLRKKIPSLPEIIESRMFKNIQAKNKEIAQEIIEQMIQNLETE
jgi:MarR family transcriptional regulator, organic hydroperoxide resistance regulator